MYKQRQAERVPTSEPSLKGCAPPPPDMLKPSPSWLRTSVV